MYVWLKWYISVNVWEFEVRLVYYCLYLNIWSNDGRFVCMFDYMSLKWKICYYDGVYELRVVD